MSDLPRRRLLALGGTALTGTIAGCSGSADEGDPDADSNSDDGESDGNGNENENGTDSSSDSDGADGASGTLLGNVDVENLDNDAHTINVIVEFDGDIEHWSTHELDAGAGATLEQGWPQEAGEFRVILRLDDGEPVQDTAASWNDPDCLNLLVTINRSGALTTHADTSSGPCGDGDASFDEGASE